MNISNNQTENNAVQCCIDYCRTIHNAGGHEVVNNYRCKQQLFSTSDLWRIRKNKR
ncbi:MAG: hypothetical protein LC128_14120 [Chitinophagales bacterium]|nr:hypothetical protein [Chitinophagales bacterium]